MMDFDYLKEKYGTALDEMMKDLLTRFAFGSITMRSFFGDVTLNLGLPPGVAMDKEAEEKELREEAEAFATYTFEDGRSVCDSERMFGYIAGHHAAMNKKVRETAYFLPSAALFHFLRTADVAQQKCKENDDAKAALSIIIPMGNAASEDCKKTRRFYNEDQMILMYRMGLERGADLGRKIERTQLGAMIKACLEEKPATPDEATEKP